MTSTRKKQLFNNSYGKIHANKVNALRSNLAGNTNTNSNSNNSSRVNRLNVQTDRTNPPPSQSFRISNPPLAGTNRTKKANQQQTDNKNDEKMMIKQFRTTNMPYSPLQTPPRLKALNGHYDFPKSYNTTSNDPYSNINPLPSIRSPYQSSRDNNSNFPNLESWGITNQASLYDDPNNLNLYRYNPSPLLPMYGLVSTSHGKKNKKQKVKSSFSNNSMI